MAVELVKKIVEVLIKREVAEVIIEVGKMKKITERKMQKVTRL